VTRVVLQFQGIEAASPRAVIKEAFKIRLIDDGDGWIDMLEDRNKTSHIYDEAQARAIYDKIKESHVGLFLSLDKKIQSAIEAA
jgi:nucleotidyltransferase substrate binding protein (TIGR01987 family)